MEHTFKDLKNTFHVFAKPWMGDFDEYNIMFRFACSVLNIIRHSDRSHGLCSLTSSIFDASHDDRDPFSSNQAGSDEDQIPSRLEELRKALQQRTKSPHFLRVLREMSADEGDAAREEEEERNEGDQHSDNDMSQDKLQEFDEIADHRGLGFDMTIDENIEEDMGDQVPSTPLGVQDPNAIAQPPILSTPHTLAPRVSPTTRAPSVLWSRRLSRVHKARSPTKRLRRARKPYSP